MFKIEVQFPGSPKTYDYTSPTQPELGQRCVVPTIIKKDGTVALSIATVVGLPGFIAVPAGDAPIKPIVALLDNAAIQAAQNFVLDNVPAASEVV